MACVIFEEMSWSNTTLQHPFNNIKIKVENDTVQFYDLFNGRRYGTTLKKTLRIVGLLKVGKVVF